jgi:hypothetical protein
LLQYESCLQAAVSASSSCLCCYLA